MKASSISFALTLLLGATGCAHVVTVPSPRDYIALNQPRNIWVTTRTQAEVRVESPTLRGDTLIGYVHNQPAIIPFADITLATIRDGSNTDKLVKYSGGIGVAIIAAVLVYKVAHQATFHSP